MNPSSSAVDTLLQNPAGTLVIGPKAVPHRRRVRLASLGTSALSWVKTASAALLVGAAVGLAAHQTGAGIELKARVHPSLPIMASAERLRWVDLPTNPFIEAGRTADGGLSMAGLIHGWKDAGLPSDSFDEVRWLITPLMPTLLGRDDALLESQLKTEAVMANARLQARFPQVWDRLSRGETVSVSDAENEQWAALYLAREASFYADPQMKNAHYSLQARAQAMASVADPSVAAFLQPGVDDQGRFDAARMFQAWQQAGIDTGTAAQLVELLDEALPVMGGGTAASRHDQAQRAAETMEILDAQFAAVIHRLQHGEAGTLSAAQEQEWTNDQAYLMEDVQAGRRFATEAVSWEQARAALAQAVEQSGLRSLTVALADWDSPERLMEQAAFLKAANQELQHVTGWPGQVLGLSGRVELTLGTPQAVPGTGGITTRNEAGRLQVVTEQRTLAHEWFHALDYTVASTVLERPNQQTMSENLQWLRQAKDGEAKQAWKRGYEGVMDAAPTWQSHRQHAGQENPYWMEPAEGIAFAFAAQFHDNPDSVLHDSALSGKALQDPQRLPSNPERLKQSPFFQALFKDMASQRLSQDTPTVAQWRSQRQKMATEQPLMLKRGHTFR